MQELWRNTVAALPSDQGLDTQVTASYRFFADLAELSQSGAEHLIDLRDLAPLIAQGAEGHQAPQNATGRSLAYLYRATKCVNLAEGLLMGVPDTHPDAGDISVAAGGRRLIGFEYFFEVLIKALDVHAAEAAARILTEVYIRPYSVYDVCYRSWQLCVPTAVCIGSRDASLHARHGSAHVTLLHTSLRCAGIKSGMQHQACS